MSVKATKQPVSYFPEAVSTEPQGVLTASTTLELVDLHGRVVVRRVRAGTAHCISLDTARVMTEQVRAANPSKHIQAQITFSL